MNTRTVAFSVVALIIIAIIAFLLNPGNVKEETKILIIETSIRQGETTIEESQPFGGGLGGFFGGLFGGGSSSGGVGSGGGGGGGSGGGLTSTIVGGPTSTIIGGTSTTSIVVGGNTTTTIIGSTTTSTTIIGGTTSTSTSTVLPASTSTTVTGCASNFVIDYNLDCKGTSGTTDDDAYVSIANNNGNGYSLDVYVDNSLERSGFFIGLGGLGLINSNVMTSWWRSQVSSGSRIFNVRLEYSGSCSITQTVTVDFPGTTGCQD